MPSTEEVSSENVLHSDAKSIGKIVEVDTRQLEKYLCAIQETLGKHELSNMGYETRVSVSRYRISYGDEICAELSQVPADNSLSISIQVNL